jgi:hypothetical protein
MTKNEIIESLVALADAEERSSAEVRRELRAVRERLERELGGAVRAADAARALGISRAAMKRWLDRGEVASVLTPGGRREIPAAELVPLVADVRRAREDGRDRALAAVIRARRRAADEVVDIDRLLPRRGRTHREPELHSLAYHRLVAGRLTPRLVEDARARLDRWERAGRIDARWTDEWRRILDLPLEQIAKRIGADGVRARELRQSSPFAGILTEQERQRLLSAVEARG